MFLKLCTLLFLIAFASAQSSKVTVPSDLSSQFDPNSIALQVSYNGNAEDGLLDGTQVTQQDSLKTPVFALGDASGVNTAITFVIAMVDTTTSNRVLHFLQPDFKADGTQTGISSGSKATVAYQAPGTLGDTRARQYSWLLYQQAGAFPANSIPESGKTFDVETFQTANNLKPALAGVAMAVNVAGAASTSVASALPPPVFASSAPPLPTTAPAVFSTTPVIIATTPASSASFTADVPLTSTSVAVAVTFVSVQPSSTIAALVSSLVSSIVSADAFNSTAIAGISSSLSSSGTGAIGSALGSASSTLRGASTTLVLQISSATVSSSIAQSTGGAASLTQDLMISYIMPLLITLMGTVRYI